MTFGQFNDFMEDLYNYYGERCRKGDRATKEYYDAVKGLPDTEVNFLYKTIVRNHKFFPGIPDMVEIAGMKRQQTRLPVNREKCYCCMDTGVIPYYRKGFMPFPNMMYEFWAACPECELGMRLGQNGPWLLFDRLFDRATLDNIRRDNLQKFGAVSESTVERAKEKAELYIKRMAG